MARVVPCGPTPSCPAPLAPAVVRFGDRQLNTVRTPAGQETEELGPEGLSLRGAARHPAHLVAAAVVINVDDGGNDHSHRDDAVSLPDFDADGIESMIWPVAFQRVV
jgi:hypothetical protein